MTATNVATVTGVEPEVGDASRPATTPQCAVVRVRHRDRKSANKQVVGTEHPGRVHLLRSSHTGETVSCPTCAVTDDKCSPVTYASGDANEDGKL